MIEERDVDVKMRDGVALAVDIFRPATDGRFPALVAISAYGKGMQSLSIPTQDFTAPLYCASIEAGDSDLLVSHGYVHIIADTRGTNKSGGQYRGWMSQQEAEDGYDLIEWAAVQPWCDGNVGMVGISYYGTVQLRIAAERPPHLKAIMPWNCVADYYREATHHGGIVQTFFHHLYSGSIHCQGVSVTLEGLSEEEQKALIEKLKQDRDLQMYPRLYNLVDVPHLVPCFFDILANPYDGPFYWERSPAAMYDRIKIPFYARSSWWAYGHMHLVGAFWNYLGIDAPKKLRIDGMMVEDRPLPKDYNEEVVRWYNYWLKGMDTGIMDEPPVQFALLGLGPNQWREEHEWPLKRTQWTKYYLHRWKRLMPDPELFHGHPDTFVQQPLDETTEVASVEYLTPPIEEDMEVIGPLALYLHAAIDQDDTNWIVIVRDVAPDGRERELSKGFLKASHRAVDAGRSKPWEPYHLHTHKDPVKPGEVYAYALALAPIANVFRTGHQLKLVITCMDHAKLRTAAGSVGDSHAPWHLCSSRTTMHQIFHDPDHPSHLVAPVIPKLVGRSS